MSRIRTMLIYLTVFSVAAAPLAGWAEPAPLSLPALLDEARRVNPELAAARARWEAAQARVPLATGLPAPKIGVEWESIPRGTLKLNQADLMYQLVQSLPFPGKLSARKRVALAEAQMAAATFKQTEWDVLTRVKAAYYDLFLMERELEIAREQQLWMGQIEAAARARYATGAAPEAELLQAQTDALEAANQVTVVTHRWHAMAAHLNHLLNRPGHAAGSPAPIPLASVPSSPDELLATAMQQQPDLLVMKFAAERADAAHRLAKRELWPDLETMLELRNPAMGPIGPWDLSLALVLPFWFWTKQRYGVKAALYDRDSAAAAYEAMRRDIERRVHEHWHEAAAASASAVLARDQAIPSQRQAVASALAAYQGGRGSFLDVLMALRALSERERAYYEQLVTVEQHVAMLEQAVGVPLRDAPPITAPTAGGQS
ncbi:MAG: TolC family protein [Candidatus Omnitrophica bacterium]|nr:TolC family protein [Candidatus Omnitrophota bacterium]